MTIPKYYVGPARCRKCNTEIECSWIADHFSFPLGNVIKYVWRAGRKHNDELEDLKKARDNLDRRIAELEYQGEKRNPWHNPSRDELVHVYENYMAYAKTREAAQFRARVCAHCGRRGAEAVIHRNSVAYRLCHPNNPALQDCYRLVTVYDEKIGSRK